MLAALKQVADDIEAAGTNTRSTMAKELFASITSTMSDRAATCVRQNTLLQMYREEILPIVRQSRPEEMGDEDVEALLKMNHFFCGLHSLVHLAENAVQAGEAAEKAIVGEAGIPSLNPAFQKKGESAAARLIREGSKALSRGGDEKNGIYRQAFTFLRPVLKERYGALSLPIVNYRGNRFNILFTNSVAVYCLRNQLKELLSISENPLIKSVSKGLNNDVVLAGVHALAKVAKSITGPFWRVMETKSINIVQMNQILTKLVKFFDDAAENPSLLMEGNSPFDDEYIHRDQWYADVFASNSRLDPHTSVIVGIMMKSFGAFARRHFKDHLEGGVHANLTAEEVEGVPLHDMFSERGFGFWDRLKRFIPNISSEGAEACLLFTMNKTLDWLEAKPADERERLIKACMQQTPKMKETFKERALKIRQELESRLQRQLQEKAEKEAQQLRDKMALQSKVEEQGGLWQSVDQMESALQAIKDAARGEAKKKRIDAIKAQMSYRKKVLQQSASATDFTFSENKVVLGEERLKEKLAKLISLVPSE